VARRVKMTWVVNGSGVWLVRVQSSIENPDVMFSRNLRTGYLISLVCRHDSRAPELACAPIARISLADRCHISPVFPALMYAMQRHSCATIKRYGIFL
jgi:hypothetical protein